MADKGKKNKKESPFDEAAAHRDFLAQVDRDPVLREQIRQDLTAAAEDIAAEGPEDGRPDDGRPREGKPGERKARFITFDELRRIPLKGK